MKFLQTPLGCPFAPSSHFLGSFLVAFLWDKSRLSLLNKSQKVTGKVFCNYSHKSIVLLFCNFFSLLANILFMFCFNGSADHEVFEQVKLKDSELKFWFRVTNSILTLVSKLIFCSKICFCQNMEFGNTKYQFYDPRKISHLTFDIIIDYLCVLQKSKNDQQNYLLDCKLFLSLYFENWK